MKTRRRVSDDFKTSGREGVLLTNPCCKRQELYRRSFALLVLRKRDNGRFYSNVFNGRATELIGLFLEAKQHFPASKVQHGVVGGEPATDQTLEPHEEHLTHRRSDTNAHVEQRGAVSTDGVHG